MPVISRRGIAAAIAAAIPTGFLGIFFLWPVGVTLHRAMYGHGLASAPATVAAGTVSRAALTTLMLACAGTLLSLGVGLPATWALYRRDWRGARFIASALSAPFVLPTVVVSLAFLTLQRDVAPWLSAWHGKVGIVAALAFFNVAVVLRTVGPALGSIDERLVMAARTLGASRARIAARIIVPSIRKSVMGATVVTFVFCSTSFALVLLLGGTRVQTLETAAYLELTTFLNLRGAALIALVQAGIVALVTGAAAILVPQRARTAMHGGPLRARARRRDLPLVAVALLPAVLLVVTPLATLGVQSARTTQGRALGGYRALSDAVGAGGLSGAILTSGVIGALAALVALVVACLAVVASALHPQFRWVRILAMTPLAASSVLVGVGLLVALAVPLRSWGDRGTWVLLVAAQALVAVPLVVRVVAPAVDALDPLQAAAAASLGASPRRVLCTVVLPQVRSALQSAAGLAFAVAVGEFGASVFLARPDSPTLPTAIVKLLGKPGADHLSTAAAGAVVLALMTTAAILASEIRVGRRP